MIDVHRLSKSYGAFRAVSDISFHVERGEVVGFLGPNGAGKSTTLRMLAGFLGPSAGRIRIDGHDIADEPILSRQKLGYMPETCPLYPEMRVREYLAFRAELKRLPRRDRSRAVDDVSKEVDIADVGDVLIRHLSKGYRQRVGLADALLGDPPVLILDEPTAGMDPNQIRQVRDLVRKRGDKHAILLSTHILSEVEATCTRALVIARGKLVASGSIAELREMRRASGLRIVVRGDRARALEVVRASSGVAKAAVDDTATPSPDAITITASYDRDAQGNDTAELIVSALVDAGLFVREVVPRAASLEQVFAELTRGDERFVEDESSSSEEPGKGDA
ncbi:MAG: ABC transporter ATP-binding protein [Polyangiaceae bacterium]|nr:ABC transporter ATP-binding protein [Polyangiaceae bacterium]